MMVSNWRPIETAPQDGSEQLVARITGVRIQWAYMATHHNGISWKMPGGYCHPTHWTPRRTGE